MELKKVNSVDINNGENKYAQVTLCVEEGTGLAIVQVHFVDGSDRCQFYYLPKEESDDSLVIQNDDQAIAFMMAVQAAVIQSLIDFGQIWQAVSGMPIMEAQYAGELPYAEVELHKNGGNLINEYPPE